MNDLKNLGQYEIYLTGSRRSIHRSVRTDGEKFFVIWGGQLIEVKRGTYRYYTVLDY